MMSNNSLTDYLGAPEAFELRINLSDNPDSPKGELDEVWIAAVEPAKDWAPSGLEVGVLRALGGTDEARPALVFEHKRSA